MKNEITINENRKFEGVWIPARLYASNKFNPREKFMLIEIKSLSANGSCYAQDKHFSDFLGVSTRQVQIMLKKFKEEGYVETSYDYDETGKVIIRRYISLTEKFYDEFINENFSCGGTEKNFHRGTEKNFVEKYNNKTIYKKSNTSSDDDGNTPLLSGEAQISKFDKLMDEYVFPEYQDECREVLGYFFEEYEHRLGKCHPCMPDDCYRNVLRRYMNGFYGMHCENEVVDIEEYKQMIDEYFNNRWRKGTILSIAHFFSDGIRSVLYERIV